MDNNKDIAAINKLCRWIRVGGGIFVVSVLLVYLITWCWPGMPRTGNHAMVLLHLAGLPATAMAEMPVITRLLIASISLPYLLTLLWAFYRLNLMLRGFERAEFFEAATVGHLRAFAGFLLLAKVFSLAAMHARVGVMAHIQGHQHSLIKVNLSSDDMAVLLMCALFFLVARMMEQARRLAEENREFI